MKHIHKADMIAHLWANQSQDSAHTAISKSDRGAFGYGRNRNPGAASLSFSGPVLYSYSTPIAMLHKARRGTTARHSHANGTVALVTSETFSVTTSAQQRKAKMAASHLAVFTVPFIGHTVSAGRGASQPHNWRVLNREYLTKQYCDECTRLMTARRPLVRTYCDSKNTPYQQGVEYELTRLAGTVGMYSAAFGLKPSILSPAVDAARIVKLRGAIWDRHEFAAAARRAAASATYEAARIKGLAEATEAIAAWRRGEKVRLPWGASRDIDGSAMLRVLGEVKGLQAVETSLGAQVPASEAQRAIVFTAECKRTGQAWARNGTQFPVGQFQLDSVSAAGDVRAGCHFIVWAEVARLAEALEMRGLDMSGQS